MNKSKTAVKKSVGRSKPVKKAVSSARSVSAAKPVKKSAAVSAAVKPRSAKVSAVAVASKPVKKRSASAAKFAATTTEPKYAPVPLAEVEVLAAKAEKMIKAKRSLPAAEKAERLARLARTLENARVWGGLSASGAWVLAHPFGLGIVVHDWKAVLR
ncbi:hypothetical protein R80B4_01403 [Fibrobacteres bacterium R8-0-B4]